MNAPLGATRFDRWLIYVLDRPVVEPGWWFEPDSDAPEVLGAMDAVAFMTQMCEHADNTLAPYSDAQVSQGLWYIIGSGASEWALAAVNGGVPPADWVRCVRAFSLLFDRLFAPRCTPHLGHLSEPGAGSLNMVCYMWWDIIYLPGWQDEAERARINAACLEVMRETLELASDACRESALHGLGHWQIQNPERVAEIIDKFLAGNANLRPELARYAQSAWRLRAVAACWQQFGGWLRNGGVLAHDVPRLPQWSPRCHVGLFGDRTQCRTVVRRKRRTWRDLGSLAL